MLTDGELEPPGSNAASIIRGALAEWNETMEAHGAPVVVATDQLAEMIALDLAINGAVFLDRCEVRAFPSLVIDAVLGLIHLRAQAEPRAHTPEG